MTEVPIELIDFQNNENFFKNTKNILDYLPNKPVKLLFM
jgi:hypothetical protein